MKRSTGAGTIAALTLACVFGVTMLLSLATGAGVYQRVADRVERSARQRVGLAYITAKVHAYDRTGGVRAGRFGEVDAVFRINKKHPDCEVDAVFLTEELEGVAYETALYVHEGWMKEAMYEQGWTMSPEDGTAITEAQSLTAEMGDGLLTLTYIDPDGRTETAKLMIRSGGQG